EADISPWTVEYEGQEDEVNADECERLEKPADEAPRATSVSESKIRLGQNPQQIHQPDDRSNPSGRLLSVARPRDDSSGGIANFLLRVHATTISVEKRTAW